MKIPNKSNDIRKGGNNTLSKRTTLSWNRDTYSQQVKANMESSANRKVYNYFLDVIKKDSFQNKVSILRNKYLIPIKKIKPSKLYFSKTFDSDLKILAEAYSLYFWDWRELLFEYVVFGEIESKPASLEGGLCKFIDEFSGKELNFYGSKEDLDINFPLSIRLSPYASKRDILDYVKRMYPTIKVWQSIYMKSDVKLGKVKSKNPIITARDEFIYKNRDKTGKEIKKLVQDKFGDNLSYEYIPKIIFSEKKKRQKA